MPSIVMKIPFYVLAGAACALLISSVVKISMQFSEHTIPMLSDVKGFEDVNKRNDKYTKLVQRFRTQINLHKVAGEKHQQSYFWLNFLVTVLTAASTLVAAIQASKNQSTDNAARLQKFAIIIAILAFCSTLTNFGSSHFNDKRNEEAKIAVDLSTLRTQFYADYEKASEDKKTNVISAYDERLD